MQVDPVKKGTGKDKGKHQNKKGTLTNNNTSNTDINTCKNCGRTGHWVKDCSRPGGRADNNSNNNDNSHNNNKNKGKNNRKGKGQGKQLETCCKHYHFQKQPQPRRYQSQTSRTTESLWCNPDTQQKGWIMTLGGVTMSFTVSNRDKLVQKTCFLTAVHSIMHVQSSIQDREYHCQTLDFTQRVELVSNMMDDVW